MAADQKTRGIIREANEWLIRMMEPGASSEDEAGFAAWLRQSPVHVREYLRAESVFAAMAGVDAERRIDVDALLGQEDQNVVELGQVRARGGELMVRDAWEREDWSKGISKAGGPDQQDSSRSSEPATVAQDTCVGEGGRVPAAASRARSRLWATAASITLAIAAAALYVQNSLPEVYTTARGEQRRLVLEDGSVVDMNTETELSVRMDDDARRVELLKGEALFTVAKDPERPFVVDSETALVRAIGTQFNVYRQSDQVLVTVIEGRVAVERESRRRTPAGSGEIAMIEVPAVELSAGDQAAIVPQAPIRTVTANTEKAVAWRERRLIFENQPLAEVVAEFNRYNRRQLVIEDSRLAQKRISAVFDADQPEALVRFLTQNTPIRVVDTDDERLVLRANE